MARTISVSVLALVICSLILGGPAAGESEDADEVRGYYLGGGAHPFGVEYACGVEDYPGQVPAEGQFGIGAACDLRCPGGTCSITVWDDVRGDQIAFRVCVPGEDFCRPFLYTHTVNIVAPVITVAPYWAHATHGVVIVR